MAEDTQPDWRDDPIDYGRWMERFKENRLGIILFGIGITIIVFGFIFLYPAENRTFQQLVSDLYASTGVGLISIAFVVLIVISFNKQRVQRIQQESEAREKAKLIQQMGSHDNATAWQAVHLLTARGWLTDGSTNEAILWKADLSKQDLRQAKLRGANLVEANLDHTLLLCADLSGARLNSADLSGAELSWADLSETILYKADLMATYMHKAVLVNADLSCTNLMGTDMIETYLKGANLFGADLMLADLSRANLTEAVLISANFTDATLSEAILYKADLTRADLNSANLIRANLTMANLSDAELVFANLTDTNLSDATMPNGEKWYPDMDLGQFTNPEHPNFWRSDNPNSRAHTEYTEYEDY